MGYLIGRNRTARETYPQSPGAGGGSGASIVPLTRYRFIDGGTVQGGLDGSVAEPYKTASQFLAAFATSSSVADANALVVGKVTPSQAGYAEPLAIPPYRNTELRSDGQPQTITGNVTWVNEAGAGTHPPSPLATATLHNINLVGNITITDDGSVPSTFALTADEFLLSVVGTGTITATGATALAAFEISGLVWSGAVNLGTGTTSAQLALSVGGVGGAIHAKSIIGVFSTFGNNITVGGTAGSSSAAFSSCAFANSPVLTGPAGAFAQFDGVSWRNFLSAGGTVVGLIVTVVGGYDGGPVQGANIGDVAATLSENGTGAGAWAGGGNVYFQNTAITGNHVIQFLLGGGEKVGDTMRVVRTVTDANGFHLTFEDDTGATIGTLASANRGYFEVRYNGTHWVMTGGGGGLT
jgi:hypothetical protein